ncbi:MAG: YdhR family protein [Spirochaetes bacterium]|nr:YdhR family protein [Spirochaetota bacterium]MBU1080093.1 YdhR family protein [Spirochaetota bacterium]
MTNPVSGFFATARLFLSGRVSFDPSAKGKTITVDGKSFTVFRRVIVKSGKEPRAFFLVRFKPLDMSVRKNIAFSILPMMVFMGLPGFSSKYWAVDHATGLCQGLYEWETVEDARAYSESFAMRFMAARSDPDSVEFRIIDKDAEGLGISLG